jgi:chitinase
MTYDFHGSWNPFTGLNAPMYAGPHDTTPAQQEWNVQASINWWIGQGAPRNKLVVGLASYGRSFTLSNPGNNGINAPTSGPGTPGEYSQESGFLTYMEICRRVQQQGWSRVYEQSQQAPYAFSGNQWVGYDDLQSIDYKLSFIIRENLGGSMWWSLESDDFRNLCGAGSNPLIRLAQSRMTG